MKLWIPGIRSQYLQFSNSFQHLGYVMGGGGVVYGSVSVDQGADLSGGGYIVFGGRGADLVGSLSHWSIFADVSVPASGTQRALLNCGHPSLGDRFELGLASTNQLKMIGNGGASVVSDDTISAGRHTLGWVFVDGTVEFWCDGVRIGSDSITLATGSPTTLFVGASSTGTKPWGATVYKIDVYRDAFDEEEAFGASAIEGWTPRSLLTDFGGTYDNGLYLDGDEPGTYDLNTPANLLNPDFDAGVTGWSAYQSTLAHMVGGPSGITNFVRMTATGAGTAFTMYQPVGIVGNRYVASLYAARRTSTSYRVDLGNAAVLSGSNVDWMFSQGEGTWAGDTNLRVTAFPNSGYADFARIRLEQRSCKKLNYYGSGTLAGTKFAQATAANMGWKSSDGLGVRFDGVSDYFRVTAPLPQPTHIFVLCTLNAAVPTQTLVDGVAGNSMRIFEGTGGKINIYAGAQVVGPSYPAVVTSFVVDAVFNGANSKIGINGGTQVVGNAGSTDSTGITLGAYGGLSQYLAGTERKIFLVSGELSTSERAMVANYMLRAAR